MIHTLKAVSVKLLKPLARLTERILTPLVRAWSHARLAAHMSSKLDPTVVVQGRW